MKEISFLLSIYSPQRSFPSFPHQALPRQEEWVSISHPPSFKGAPQGARLARTHLQTNTADLAPLNRTGKGQFVRPGAGQAALRLGEAPGSRAGQERVGAHPGEELRSPKGSDGNRSRGGWPSSASAFRASGPPSFCVVLRAFLSPSLPGLFSPARPAPHLSLVRVLRSEPPKRPLCLSGLCSS